jgi:3-hydroxyacyl-CoA dehydrogenase
LVNEGARIVEEGIALRASDLDVVYVAGYGFPRYRGGPMFYADLVGLPEVANRMRAFAAAPRADTAFWQPAPLLERLAAEGKIGHGVSSQDSARRYEAGSVSRQTFAAPSGHSSAPRSHPERVGRRRIRAAQEFEQHGVGVRGRATAS